MPEKTRCTYTVSKSTADSLEQLHLISDVKKSDLVDAAIVLLVQTTRFVCRCSGMTSEELFNTITSSDISELLNKLSTEVIE